MENEIIQKRVLPFIITKEVKVNGKLVKKDIELSSKETKNMSCEAEFLEYIPSMNAYHFINPLVSRRCETGIRMFLCYDFDKLTEEEQNKYIDRTIVIPFYNDEKVNTKEENKPKRRTRKRK